MSKTLARVFLMSLLGLLLSGVLYAIPQYAERLFDAEISHLFSASLLMKIHGALAMIILIAFGALAQAHVGKKIKRQKNRRSGLLMLSSMLFMIVSGYGLYYLGSIEVREMTAHGHTLLGLLIILVVILHSRFNRAQTSP